MGDVYSLLQKVDLFIGLNENEIKEAISDLKISSKNYGKGEILLCAGDKITSVGIILSGTVEISRQDYAGKRFIINHLRYPAMFGEALVCDEVKRSPVTLTAINSSRVLWIDFKRVIQNDNNTKIYQNKLTHNMIHFLAKKVQFLSNRLDLLCKKTIRAKLAVYLLTALDQTTNSQIDIPYNREELADYLCTNRSALSNELCKMRDAGVINFQKNHFTIHDIQQLSIWTN